MATCGSFRVVPIFLVTPLSSNAAQIRAAVQRVFKPEDQHELQSQAGWFVVHPGTSVEVSQAIGITSPDPDFKPTLGSAVVTLVGAYYGRGPTVMWEWLKTRVESQR